MPQDEYGWERFWCPRDGSLRLDLDGFLADPTGKYGKAYNPDSVPFSEIDSTRCLVLIGEPGMGKSHELRKIFGAVEASAISRGDMALYMDLRSQTDYSLRTDLFRSKALMAWNAGNCNLHLFLDSLDECLMRIDNVTAIIEEELAHLHSERLFLRIACRTADWPIVFEQHLGGVFGKGNVGILELMPLRERDAEAAATQEGVDCTAFMEAVYRHNAVPLAMKPVTLRMLMGLFRRDGSFPARQSDLYEEGCLLMCDEHDEIRRRSAKRRGTLASVLLEVSSRIAAVTVFCNRYAVWTAPDMGDMPAQDVSLRDLAGGVEPIDGSTIQVTEALVLEAVGTGLFSSRGPHRMGWAHRTYEEFLAARYLSRHSMADEQVLSLLVHPGDPGGKLVPQLHETAAWVAGANDGVFAHIAAVEPDALLRSDVGARASDEKAKLVSAILGLYDAGLTIDRFDLSRDYSRLLHPALCAQLRPHIVDKERKPMSRAVAVDIAKACELQELLPDMLRVTLDMSDDLDVRVKAAYAIWHIGDACTKSQMKPLLLGQAGPDPNDELKGCALWALWPSSMTASEMFSALTPRKNDTLSGAYSAFIHRLSEPVNTQMMATDLTQALSWASSHLARNDEFRAIVESIMQRAWEELMATPAIATQFAELALARLRGHEGVIKDESGNPLREDFLKDHGRRRLLLSAVLKLPSITDKDMLWVFFNYTPLATADDLAFLADQLRSEVASERRRLVAKLICDIFSQTGWTDPHNASHVHAARSLCPDCEDLFSFLDIVVLDSAEAQKTKEDWLKMQLRQKRLAKVAEGRLLVPSPIERVIGCLDKFEAGDRDAWWQLCVEMTLEPTDEYYDGQRELNPDITDLPVWAIADQHLRCRILTAAEVYTLDPVPMDYSWLGTNSFDRPATSGYKALFLLAQERPGVIDGLVDSAWRKWAPAIMSYPLGSDEHQDASHIRLMEQAYRIAGDDVLSALGIEIRGSMARSEHLSMSPIERLRGPWDNRIADALYKEMRAIENKPKAASQLLCTLIERRYAPAIAYADQLLALPLPTANPERAFAFEAAKALALHVAAEKWPRLWSAIQSDEQFGRALVEDLPEAFHSRKEVWFSHLTEGDMADLFIWMARHYPYESEDRFRDRGIVTPHRHALWLRDSILNLLIGRGTREACREVSRVAKEFPQYTWLKHSMQRTDYNFRRTSWVPPLPRDVVSLANDSKRRYVENGRQLLHVVLDSLRNLDERLHGTPSEVEFLWDKKGTARAPKWMPKDEIGLSVYVERHLKDQLQRRGIVVNREVQIRREDRTDVNVDAVRTSGRDDEVETVSVIVEVKGCWHLKLQTAMRDQLVDRYLKDNPSPNGIYLVGWFDCAAWTPNDPRKRSVPAWSLEGAREFFARQASDISQSATLPNLTLSSYVLDTRLPERKRK